MKKKVIDLYAVLRTHKEATAEEIKKAFRKRSKETHPDHNGDREEFERVSYAYKILSDKEKRKFYDKTGCVKTEEIDFVSIATQLISEKIDKFLANLKGNIFHLDVIQEIINLFQKDINEFKSQMEMVRKSLKILMKLKRKTQRKEVTQFPPIIFDFIERKKTEFVGAYRQLEANKTYSEFCIKILNEYEFSKEESLQMTWSIVNINLETGIGTGDW